MCVCVFQTQFWPRWVPLCLSLFSSVQGDSVCVCVCFRPSIGQDGFPSACLCSVVYKVIVCVCVCVSDPVLAKMGSPLPVFVQQAAAAKTIG